MRQVNFASYKSCPSRSSLHMACPYDDCLKYPYAGICLQTQQRRFLHTCAPMQTRIALCHRCFGDLTRWACTRCNHRATQPAKWQRCPAQWLEQHWPSPARDTPLASRSFKPTHTSTPRRSCHLLCAQACVLLRAGLCEAGQATAQATVHPTGAASC